MSEKEVTEEYIVTPVKGKKKSEKGCYSAFALTGFICGIFGLVTSVFGVTFIIPVLGIIFGGLGEKSIEYGDKGHSGKIMGIIGTAVSIIFIVGYFGLLIKGLIKGGTAAYDFIKDNW